MSDTRTIRHPIFTVLGLLLAIFGTPLFLWGLKVDLGDASSLPIYLGREAGVFAMLALLLWLVRQGERLPFSSIGWHTDRLGSAALWGLLGVVLCALGLAACVGIAYLMHWKIGAQEPPKFDPPLWAVTITVLRAGITEEAFYRGYSMERLITLTGRKWVAVVMTAVPFALFHYRQGPAGILIALVAALVLSWLYLKRRSLPTVMLAHFTVDFIPNVLLPLLGAG